jgi:hypothetical protein
MALVKDNLVTEGLSGKLGKRLVIRHMKDGRTIFATRPNYEGHVWTAGQGAHHNRFREAAAYARLASKTNPLYAALAAGTSRNAYNIALADWFHAPVIHRVTRQADCIRVEASDDIGVTEVRVTVCDDQGNLLEQGQAVLTADDCWEYQAKTQGQVSVEAFDLAGNLTRQTESEAESGTPQYDKSHPTS